MRALPKVQITINDARVVIGLLEFHLAEPPSKGNRYLRQLRARIRRAFAIANMKERHARRKS